MSALAKFLRNALRARGYDLRRLDATESPTLRSCLESLQASAAIARVVVADTDTRTLNEVLGVFPPENVSFESGRGMQPPGRGTGAGALLVATDLAGLGSGFAGLHQVKEAACVIVRVRLEQPGPAGADILDLLDAMRAAGLELIDAISRPPGTALSALLESAHLVFQRTGRTDTPGAGGPREYRKSEALAHLSAPIVTAAGFSRLTGRGSQGFAAGVLNPGAIAVGDRILLLARGERIPWPVLKRQPEKFVPSTQPLLLHLGRAGVEEVMEARFAKPRDARFEDFRLFAHRGRTYANHSAIAAATVRESGVPLRPELLHSLVTVSELDAASRTLSEIGTPVLGRTLARSEKNWAMFSDGDRVHLIYSFQPYRLYTAPDFPALAFKGSAERALRLPWPDDGLPLRNSINPVVYDEQHFLHIVHKVYPTKRYVFWAVLIDRRSLLPTRFAPRPLLRAGASADTSILYACSAVVQPEKLLIFGGIDDCAIGKWELPRADLDRHWISISS